ncbi:MAG: hypothetical protein O7F09_03425 [Chloroflexi bacterium]|nr:hypothetical protein [Chloroflexota bacterium]MCZ6891547.1 hypothetical protein [Chloroflexota bacterium]
MLHRLIERVRGAGEVSGFEAYLADLQRRGYTGVPTMHEAYLDYRALIQRENPYWMI